MAFDQLLAGRVRNVLRRAGVKFEAKPMMGGLCFMVNGKMCVGVERERLMARIDPAVYEAALLEAGCAPMDFTGRPMRGFVFVSLAALSTDEALGKWLKLALEFNPTAKAKAKSKNAGTRKQKIAPAVTARKSRRN